jgi:D-alanyl-D-alanine carboxypeptidase
MKPCIKWIVIFSSLLMFVFPATAQDEPDLQGVLDSYVAEDDPGIVVYISTPDETWTAAQGLADLENGTPVETDDLFRIGSTTKTFVAVVTLQLAQEGVLSLDDPMTAYLPAEITSQIEYGDVITLRQLLNMTSGIFNYTETDYFDTVLSDPGHVWAPEETVAYVYGLPGYFPPGEGYYYSNTNYNLLQMIIEKVTGSTLDAELESRIFEPLGMENSFLEVGDRVADGIVQGYSDIEGDAALDNVTLINDSLGLGDGGIVSTAADLDLFIRGLFEGDLLEEATLEEMMTWVDDGEGGSYGLGLNNSSTEELGEAYGHSGATAGFQSDLMYLPEEELTVVVLTNNFDSVIIEDVEFDALAEVLED